MKTATALTLVVVLTGTLATAKKKDRAWQTGFLESSSYEIYDIEGVGYRFRAQYSVPLYGRDHRVPNVTVDGWVRYALDDGTFYILDEDGREFKTSLLEKRISGNVVTIDQVREFATKQGISEGEAARKYSQAGFHIKPPPPAAPVIPPGFEIEKPASATPAK